MIHVALRMLTGDRLKYVGLVAGVAFAALLITQQASIFAGFARRTTAPLRDFAAGNPDVHLWVVDGQTEMLDDIKNMSATALDRVRSTPGVAWAVPMGKTYLQAKLPGGRVQTIRLIGLDDASLVGGPPVVTRGSLADLRRARAVMLPESQIGGGALDLQVGERFSVNDNEVEVVGAFDQTAEFFWEPVAYTTYNRLLQVAPPERKRLTYVLVSVRDGEDVQAVAERIEARTGHRAMTTDALAAMTRSYVLEKTGILINFGITIGLGVVIGLLVAGQTFYTFVLDNLRHFAALKAMGAGPWVLLKMLLAQVTLVGLVGFGCGLLWACVTGYLFGFIDLAFEMLWFIPPLGAAATLGCCVVAGCLGLIRVLRLEPAVVFK